MQPIAPANAPVLRAVLFDFDGTLVDSYPAIAASVNHVRARRHQPPLPESEVRKHVGRGPYYLIEHTVGEAHVEEDLAEYRAHHPSVMLAGTKLLPGAISVLASLRRSGRRLALCSNKPRPFSQEILVHLGLREYFEVVIGPEDVDRPKPAPDMVKLALLQLGVSPTEALYVGDMSVDIQTGHGAGVPVWVVSTGSESEQELRLAQPDRLLRDLAELLDLLYLDTLSE